MSQIFVQAYCGIAVLPMFSSSCRRTGTKYDEPALRAYAEIDDIFIYEVGGGLVLSQMDELLLLHKKAMSAVNAFFSMQLVENQLQAFRLPEDVGSQVEQLREYTRNAFAESVSAWHSAWVQAARPFSYAPHHEVDRLREYANHVDDPGWL